MVALAHTYIESLGRRKEAIARVRMHHGGSGKIVINERPLEDYLPLITLRDSVIAPLKETGTQGVFDISVKVAGGGVRGQAESIRLGIARGLIDFNPEFRSVLKKLGMLSRDARVRERKKPGKKSARRSPQWSKR